MASGSLCASVRALTEQGKVIQAIKLLREETGLGLKEAKDAVEAHLRGLRH
jgi:large subunit ribosomal protein L7/L12